MSVAGSAYHFRAYMDTILNYNQDAKLTWLSQEMFYKDTPGAFNSLNQTGEDYNMGLNNRQEFTNDSNEFDILFTPRLELFNQERMLIPCDLRLKFIRSSPEFYLMNQDLTKKYKIKFLSGSLFLRTMQMSERFNEKLSRELNDNKLVKYPMLRNDVTTFLIPQGTTTVSYPMSKLGKQPIRIYLALIPNSAETGSYPINPYNFQPYNLTSSSFVIGGKTFPTVPLHLTYTPDGSGGTKPNCYLRVYNELQRTTGVLNINDGFGISRSEYPMGYFILGQKTTEAASDTYFAPNKQGNLIVNLSFGAATPEAISCILFFEYQNTVTIDVKGSVQLDYTT